MTLCGTEDGIDFAKLSIQNILDRADYRRGRRQRFQQPYGHSSPMDCFLDGGDSQESILDLHAGSLEKGLKTPGVAA